MLQGIGITVRTTIMNQGKGLKKSHIKSVTLTTRYKRKHACIIGQRHSRGSRLKKRQCAMQTDLRNSTEPNATF